MFIVKRGGAKILLDYVKFSVPHSPQKKALQISVAPFLILVSQKISQKCIKYCESTARNSKELHQPIIQKYLIVNLYF
jgi:hypothetical protein